MYKKLYLLLLISFFAQAAENNSLSIETFPGDILGIICRYMSFGVQKNLEITCKHFKEYCEKSLKDSLNRISIYDFVNGLYFYKENEEKFNCLIEQCSEENFFALQGFNFFKSKRTDCSNESRKFLENNKKDLCESIVAHNNQKYVKFFMPYSLTNWIIKNYKNDLNYKSVMIQKIIKDIAQFFGEKVDDQDIFPQKNFDDLLCKNVQNSYGDKKVLLNKALKEKNLTATIFMFHMLTPYRIGANKDPVSCYEYSSNNKYFQIFICPEENKTYYDLVKTDEERKILAQANVSFYDCLQFCEEIGSGYYLYSLQHCPVNLAVKAILNKDFNQARCFLKLMFEQGDEVDIYSDNLDDIKEEKYRSMGILPYLLMNNASDIIKSLFKLKFHLDSLFVEQAISKQIKEIVKLIREEYGIDAGSKIDRCDFLCPAVITKDVDLVEFLITNGADINDKGRDRDHPPIGYSLNSEGMVNYFIKNISLLKKGKVEFFAWERDYKKENVIKLIRNNYFCEEDFAFDFIFNAINSDDSILYEIIVEELEKKYKALTSWAKHLLFKKVLGSYNLSLGKKILLNFFWKNDFNMFEELKDHTDCLRIEQENETYLSDVLKVIDEEQIINDYEKYKNKIPDNVHKMFLEEVETYKKLKLLDYFAEQQRKKKEEEALINDCKNRSIKIFPADILNIICQYISFGAKKNLEITCKHFKKYFLQSLKNSLNGISIYSFIDYLYSYKENEEKFDCLVNNCSEENFFALQGFNFFKSKRMDCSDESRNLLENNKQALFESIIAHNNQKYVKFFMPYSLMGWIIKNYKNDLNYKSVMIQKIIDDIAQFFGKKVDDQDVFPQKNFYDLLCENVQNSYDEWKKLLNKALKEKNLTATIFMFHIRNSYKNEQNEIVDFYQYKDNHSYHKTFIESAYDESYYEIFKIDEERKILAQANVPLYENKYFHTKNKIICSLEERPVHLAVKMLFKKDLNEARSFFKLANEQGDQKISIYHYFYKTQGLDRYFEEGLLPYLLNQKAIDIINFLFKSDFHFCPDFMLSATKNQVKDIVSLMQKEYEKDIGSKIDEGEFLHSAVKCNKTNLAKFLIANGADINYKHLSKDYPPIGYSLNNEDMVNFFIEKKDILEKGKVEFIDWSQPYKKENVIKLIKSNYFCEKSLVKALIYKAINRKDFILSAIIFETLGAQYKILDLSTKYFLFREIFVLDSSSSLQKDLLNFFWQNEFNMFEVFLDRGSSSDELGGCVQVFAEALKSIDEQKIIDDYNKCSKKMSYKKYKKFLEQAKKLKKKNLSKCFMNDPYFIQQKEEKAEWNINKKLSDIICKEKQFLKLIE